MDQDVNFNWKRYRDFLTRKNDSLKDSTGFNKAVRDLAVNHVNQFGRGKAVLMNLSPQWYNAYRESGYVEARKRDVFLKHVKTAGPQRWVWLEPVNDTTHGYEITYWKKNGRTILFVCYNPEITGSSSGGGNAAGLKSNRFTIQLRLKREIKDVRDERTLKSLPDGKQFELTWNMNEALVLSFAGSPPK